MLGALAAVCRAARAVVPKRNVFFSIANLLFGLWILLSPLEFPLVDLADAGIDVRCGSGTDHVRVVEHLADFRGA